MKKRTNLVALSLKEMGKISGGTLTDTAKLKEEAVYKAAQRKDEARAK